VSVAEIKSEIRVDGVTQEGFAYQLEDGGKTAILNNLAKVPFHGVTVIKRVTIEQANRLEGNVIVADGRVSIYFNDFQVYALTFGKLGMSLFTRIAVVLKKLENIVGADFSSRSAIAATVVGRKVYYLQQPGEVLEFDGLSGRVQLEAEDERGFNLPPWKKEGSGWVIRPWVDVLSHDLYWRR